MNFIYNNPFYGMKNSFISYKNRSFLQSYMKTQNSSPLENIFLKNKVNTNSLDSIKNSISDDFQQSVYTKLSKYKKNNNDAFQKALKRLDINNSYKGNASKLNANNSVLDLTEANSFTIKTKSGRSITLSCDNGTVYIAEDVSKLGASDIKEAEDIGHLLTYLNHDESGVLAFTSFSESSIKDMLGSIGINPGFFEIKSSSGSNKFLMLDNGSIYADYQVEAERSFYNETDLIKNAGFTKDAVCIIDGKEYKIGEDGHFNIPKGVRCVSENMIIKK